MNFIIKINHIYTSLYPLFLFFTVFKCNIKNINNKTAITAITQPTVIPTNYDVYKLESPTNDPLYGVSLANT